MSFTSRMVMVSHNIKTRISQKMSTNSIEILKKIRILMFKSSEINSWMPQLITSKLVLDREAGNLSSCTTV